MSDSDEYDAPPRPRDAHTRPTSSSRAARLPAVRRAARVDPRFEPTVAGRTLSQRDFEANYQFLFEQQAAEEAARRFRIKCLQCVLRRYALEEAGEDLTAYDLSEDERETFGEEHADELRATKLTPPSRLRQELEELKRASNVYRARSKNTAAGSRKEKVKKEWLKREAAAVRAGTKARMHFPKKQELKRAVLSDTYDKLAASGGKAAVDRYLARKQKRS